MNFSTGRLKVGPRGTDGLRLRQVVYQYDLLRHLVWRDFTLRYKQSALGTLWSLMLPLTQLLVMIFVFQSVVPLNIDAYPAFVFSTLLPWNWFSASITGSCGLFMGSRDLVRHPNFAPSRLMLITMLSNLITYLVALPILVALLLIYGRPITSAIVMLPVIMLIQGFLTTGLGLMIATLNVFYRDIQHLVTIALSLLFYLVPVFYRPQAVVAQFKIIYDLNPIAVLIQDYRSILFYGEYPNPLSLLFVCLCSLLAYGLGVLIYETRRHDIIDMI